MSSSNSNESNGTITLKSFAQLADVLDLDSLPSGPSDSDSPSTAKTIDEQPAIAAESIPVDEAHTLTAAPPDLATLIAQLADVSSGLETMARHDARAREQATIELAQYEAVAAERQEAERALTEARRVRATAELLVTEAFTEQARADAARHASVARGAELMCTQLLAERIRAADELASRPHLARVLAERRHREQERAEAAQRAEAERAARLADGIAAAKQAHREGRLEEARALLGPLARDFPSNQEIQSVLDAVRWHAQHLRVAPAEEALRDVVRRPYRDDPRAAVGRLAAVDMEGLPEDLARRVFGLWSNACSQLVRQSGMLEAKRYSPVTSRGIVFARLSSDAPHRVVSVLGLSDWQVGDEVNAQHILDASRLLQERHPSLRAESRS